MHMLWLLSCIQCSREVEKRSNETHHTLVFLLRVVKEENKMLK